MQMQILLEKVELARANFIAAASGLTSEQGAFKPDPAAWSIAENVEHMYWAEMGGINGMWKTIDGIKNNTPLWSGEAVHHGLSIEEIIEKTWKIKEQVPEIAKPRWAGPVQYWILALKGCTVLLQALVAALDELDPEKVIYPHILSGPLNVTQRLEFLRFHLERHQKQVENIKNDPNFPAKI